MTVDQLIKLISVAAEQQSAAGKSEAASALRGFAEALEPARKLSVTKLVTKLSSKAGVSGAP